MTGKTARCRVCGDIFTRNERTEPIAMMFCYDCLRTIEVGREPEASKQNRLAMEAAKEP